MLSPHEWLKGEIFLDFFKRNHNSREITPYLNNVRESLPCAVASPTKRVSLSLFLSYAQYIILSIDYNAINNNSVHYVTEIGCNFKPKMGKENIRIE